MKTISIRITEVNEVGKREMTNEELGQVIQIALDTVTNTLPDMDIAAYTKYKVHTESIEIIMTQADFDREKEEGEEKQYDYGPFRQYNRGEE